MCRKSHKPSFLRNPIWIVIYIRRMKCSPAALRVFPLLSTHQTLLPKATASPQQVLKHTARMCARILQRVKGAMLRIKCYAALLSAGWHSKTRMETTAFQNEMHNRTMISNISLSWRMIVYASEFRSPDCMLLWKQRLRKQVNHTFPTEWPAWLLQHFPRWVISSV